jgi:hypothetical protein
VTGGRVSVRVSRLALRVSGLGSRVWCFGFRISGLESRVWDLVFGVSGFGFQVTGYGLRVWGFRYGVSGFRFRVLDADYPARENHPGRLSGESHILHPELTRLVPGRHPSAADQVRCNLPIEEHPGANPVR